MAITKTGNVTGPILGLYTLVGNGGLSGTGTANLLVTGLGTLTISGAGTNITLGGVSVVGVAFGIDVQSGAHLTLGGLTGVSVLSQFNIEPGGTLTLGSAISVSLLEQINFTGAGGLAEFGSGLNLNLLGATTNFQPGATIELDNTGFPYSNSTYNAAANTLTITDNSGHTRAVPLTNDAFFTPQRFFHVVTSGGNTFITLDSNPIGGDPACFLRGTRIAAEFGDMAVENIKIGQLVRTASGGLRPVKWVGTRGYSRAFAEKNPNVQPILIAQGALADSVPARDLYMSPTHALLIDGVLVDAKALLNGTTIRRVAMDETIEYFNIEFDSHDVIISEGAATESFLDRACRAMFSNAQEYAATYPHERPAEPVFCAPRIDDGEALAAIRRRIDNRAEELARIPAARELVAA